MEESRGDAFEACEEESAPFAADADPPAAAMSLIERRRQLQNDALRLFAAKSPRAVTIRELTKACQVSPNTVYGWFGDISGLYRQSVQEGLRALGRSIASLSFDSESPRETIAAFASWTVRLFESSGHRDLLYIVVRDRADHGWLSAAYRQSVLEPLEAKLSKLVRAAGARIQMSLDFDVGEARAFVDRLFADFAMPRLLPRERTLSSREASGLLDEAVSKAVCAIREADPTATTLTALLAAESGRSHAAAG